MNPNQAAQLLAIAATYDNRKPDEVAAQAWGLALGDLRFEDCRDVIVAHYQRTREWLMPVDVISGVKRLRGERLLAFGPLTPPPDLDPSDVQGYADWIRAEQTAIADGRQPKPEPSALPAREVKGLGELMPRPPRVNPTAKAHDPEHARKMAAAKAELAARREIPVAEPLEDETEQEAS